MDDEGALGIQNWGGYYRAPPLKGNLSLQLRPSIGKRDTKPFITSIEAGIGYVQRECGFAEPSIMPMMEFQRDAWYPHNSNKMMLQLLQGNHHQHPHSYETLLPEASPHSFHMLQHVETAREEVNPVEEPDPDQLDAKPTKKRAKKKTTKAKIPTEESIKTSTRGRSVKKSMDMVINGIALDLSGMPTPVCTCTGQPQQCYRWGAGGWQSACCTTSISLYPLPMSTKRRGARIAGRKMSQGAFRKVLEKLAGEDEDFNIPIDLKLFWAKHGTNKFVTIR